MRRGFGAIFLIIMVFFLAAPVAFYVFSLGEKSEIRGASSSNVSEGFSIEINSSGGTWDLYEYGCVDLEECGEGLYSGQRLSVISGGQEKSRYVSFSGSSFPEGIKYLKFFVKPGWGSIQRSFTLNAAFSGDIKSMGFGEDGSGINALVIPADSYSMSYFKAGSFTD